MGEHWKTKDQILGYLFNMPPNWPPKTRHWNPPENWRPDASWGPAPPGWDFWVWDPSYVDRTGATSAGVAAPKPPKSRSERVTVLVVAAFIALIVGWSVLDLYKASKSGTFGSTSSNDSSFTCTHFRDVAGDIAKGILTVSEIRDKAQEIEGNSVTGPPNLQVAATEFLAGATSAVQTGNALDAAQGMAALDAACSAAGD